MPITDRVMCLARFEFSWGDTDEVQDTGYWCAPYPGGTGSTIDWETACDRIAEHFRDAWITRMDKTAFPTIIRGRRVIVYGYVDDPTVRHADHRGEAAFDSGHAWAGTSNGALPPQNTVVVSLQGYEPGEYVEQRGRHRGRMYLPTIQSGAVQNNGTLANGYNQILADAMRDYFNESTSSLDLNDGSDFHVRPVILSRAGGGPTGIAQQYSLVRSLKVGNLVDTQRRRRNRLDESYVLDTINVEP